MQSETKSALGGKETTLATIIFAAFFGLMACENISDESYYEEETQLKPESLPEYVEYSNTSNGTGARDPNNIPLSPEFAPIPDGWRGPNIDPNTVDWDRDGFLPSEGDCNNFNPDIGPGFFDYCDNLNNDCDDEIDEGIMEMHIFCTKNFNGVPTQGLLWCVHWAEGDRIVAEVVCQLDCRAEEICDNIDNDCDGEIDEGLVVPYYVDRDGDGYGDSSFIVGYHCPGLSIAGQSEVGGDCNDFDAEIYPGAGCLPCETMAYYRDADGDGYGDSSRTEYFCVGAPMAGYVESADDCNDSDPTIYPDAPEICDGLDNDCGGEVDEESCEEGFECEMFSDCFPTGCNIYYECVEIEEDNDCHGHHHTDGRGHHHHGHGHGYGHRKCDGE